MPGQYIQETTRKKTDVCIETIIVYFARVFRSSTLSECFARVLRACLRVYLARVFCACSTRVFMCIQL